MILWFFVMYGVCFALQNKFPFLYGRIALLDALLKCTFCLGFHSGWLAWLLSCWMNGFPETNFVPVALTWAFASSAFCYVLDALVQWLETTKGTKRKS